MEALGNLSKAHIIEFGHDLDKSEAERVIVLDDDGEVEVGDGDGGDEGDGGDGGDGGDNDGGGSGGGDGRSGGNRRGKEDKRQVRPLPEALIMTKYMILFDTMELLMNLPADTTLPALLTGM